MVGAISGTCCFPGTFQHGAAPGIPDASVASLSAIVQQRTGRRWFLAHCTAWCGRRSWCVFVSWKSGVDVRWSAQVRGERGSLRCSLHPSCECVLTLTLLSFLPHEMPRLDRRSTGLGRWPCPFCPSMPLDSCYGNNDLPLRPSLTVLVAFSAIQCAFPVYRTTSLRVGMTCRLSLSQLSECLNV